MPGVVPHYIDRRSLPIKALAEHRDVLTLQAIRDRMRDQIHLLPVVAAPGRQKLTDQSSVPVVDDGRIPIRK